MRQSPYRTNAPPPPEPPEPFDLFGQVIAVVAAAARAFAFAAGLAVSVFAAWACTPQEARDARDAVLSAESIACIMNSAVVHDAELAKACSLADKLIPVVHDLIGVREAGKRIGVVYRGDGRTPVPEDGGTSAPGACPPTPPGPPGATTDAGAHR